MAYDWNWNIIWQFREALLKGILVTIELSVLVVIAGTILGLIFALLRRVDHPLIKYPTVFVVEILKDLPILVLLIWLYFVLPIVGITFPGFVAAFIGLSLSLGAFVAETFRSGIESIPKGQMESAISLGYTKSQAMFKVILPQSFKQILPNLMGLYIHQIKNTALASIIAVDELLHTANIIISATYRPLEVYTAIAIIYLIIIIPVVLVSHYIERRLGIKVRTL
jgi:polar amino acid transport system permease protein